LLAHTIDLQKQAKLLYSKKFNSSIIFKGQSSEIVRAFFYGMVGSVWGSGRSHFESHYFSDIFWPVFLLVKKSPGGFAEMYSVHFEH
jgi:hypothetical protein